MTVLGKVVRAEAVQKKVDVKEAVEASEHAQLTQHLPFSHHELSLRSLPHTSNPSTFKSADMVELVEVEDESFETKQAGPSDEEDYYTDTGMPSSTINCASHANALQTPRFPPMMKTTSQMRNHWLIAYSL